MLILKMLLYCFLLLFTLCPHGISGTEILDIGIYISDQEASYSIRLPVLRPLACLCSRLASPDIAKGALLFHYRHQSSFRHSPGE